MFKLHIRVSETLPKPEKRPSRLNALILWCIAAAGLFLSALLSLLLAPALQGMNPQTQLLITNLLYYLPFIALPVFLSVKRVSGMWEALRPNPISFSSALFISLLAILGVFFVNDITILWAIPLQKLGLNPLAAASLPAAQNARELVLSVICIAIIPAICEELLFRGTIFPAFEGEGTKRAMRVTALLFMLIHGSLAGMPTQIILGLVLAMLVFWTDSIYAGVIYHTVHNASAVVLDYIQSQQGAAGAESMDLFSTIGGFGGMLSLLLSIAAYAALFVFAIRLFRVRGLLRGVVLEEAEPKKLRRGERFALIAGALICIALYASDLISMLGG